MVGKEAYRCGILKVWQQGRRVRTGKDSWIRGAEQVDGSNAVDDRLYQAVKIHDTKE